VFLRIVVNAAASDTLHRAFPPIRLILMIICNVADWQLQMQLIAASQQAQHVTSVPLYKFMVMVTSDVTFRCLLESSIQI
jgi:hypothetical protein